MLDDLGRIYGGWWGFWWCDAEREWCRDETKESCAMVQVHM